MENFTRAVDPNAHNTIIGTFQCAVDGGLGTSAQDQDAPMSPWTASQTDPTSGLSQLLADVHIGTPPGLSSTSSMLSPAQTNSMGMASAGQAPILASVAPAGALVTTLFPLDDATELQETIEAAIAADCDLIAARRMVASPPVTAHPSAVELEAANDVITIVRLLESLAFDVKSPDPFAILGMAAMDGPMPTLERIEGRRDVSSKLIRHFTKTAFEVEAHALLDSISAACDRCRDLLPQMRDARKKLKGVTKNTPLWLEVGADLEGAIGTLLFPQAAEPCVIALQLSNILRRSEGTNLDAARHLYTMLNGTAENIEAILAKCKRAPLITWASQDNGQVQKVAMAYRDMKVLGVGPTSLALVIPFDAPPGCSKASHIMDVWSHPLCHPKWKGVVTDISFLAIPCHMVVSRLHAPMHVQKPLAVFTLGDVVEEQAM